LFLAKIGLINRGDKVAFKQSSNSFTDSVADARIEYIVRFGIANISPFDVQFAKEKGLKIA